MERWRTYLESSGVDYWTICERALTLAYMDDPDDFPLHRDRLAQKLFAPEKLDLDVSEEQAPLITSTKGGRPAREQMKPHNSSDDEDPAIRSPSNCNYDDAEALTEEMEEETLLKRDVFEIKDMLLDSYKSEREIFDSLQRLEYMQLSFDVLKETEIGKTVNSLRKHSSARVRALAKKLVSEWKDTADHWYKSVEDVTAAARAEERPDSPADEEEDGLPSPPMDEGALLAGRTASIEMSQLFDFMEEETSAGSGNPLRRSDYSALTTPKRANGYADSHHESSKHGGRQEYFVKKKESDVKKDRDTVTSSNGHSKRDKDDHLTNGHDSRRLTSEKVERKVQRHEFIEKETQTVVNHKAQASKASHDSPELDQKFLAAKRKLQENYQQAELAKRQRTIQVMELQDLPKGGPKRAKAPQVVRGGKPLSQHRTQTFGRR